MALLYDADGNVIGNTSDYNPSDQATQDALNGQDVGALTQVASDPAANTTPVGSDIGGLSTGLTRGLGGPTVEPAASQSVNQYPGDRGGSALPAVPQADNSPGVLTKLAQGLGIMSKGANPTIDYSDPKVLSKILATIGTVGTIGGALMGKGQQQNLKTAAQLRSELSSPFNSWNPQQQASADAYFNNSPTAAYHPQKAPSSDPASVVKGKKYAEGGGVEDDLMAQVHGRTPPNTLIEGPGGGQDDLVHARLSPKEYVFDAETVAMLGDGNPDHGAKILDKWREQIRKHKRAAPASDIPPKAKTPEAYLQKVKV
jgi:hypothetical protein